MIEYIVAGGPVMVPIGITSVVAVALFLERLWALRRNRIIPRGLVVELLELTRQARYPDALVLCRKQDVAVSRILEAALEQRGQPRAWIKERLEEVGRREAHDLERNIPTLATIGSLGTLLGLLGTVGGMIVTFKTVEEQGAGNPATMAGGISQALVCTFAGLMIAIPAVAANRALLSKVDGLLVDLEEASLVMLDLVAGDVHRSVDEKGA